MSFKTVHGLGRAEYAQKALGAAMSNLHSPEYVDAWVKWFDAQPADVASNFTPEQLKAYTEKELREANPVMLDQCAHCIPGVVCPDDCPQPEFYPCDLEEVAHAVVSRVEVAVMEAYQKCYPERRGLAVGGPLLEALRMVSDELSEPGYVEGLLPQ
ncbi:hypothetical protein [Citrobacter portucalensis]|uniref:hypothetical protein n=1 Tax=Citrobacter portucalensis TaxID=1639133 RepID=UPI0039FBC31A